MTWLPDSPTHPGKYWWRADMGLTREELEVLERGGELLVYRLNDNSTRRLSELRGLWWWGPPERPPAD